MKLVIDQGNTQSKAAIFDGKKMISKKDFNKESTSELENYIKSTQPTQIIISSVINSPINTSTFNTIHFTTETPLPIKNKYTTLKTLGLDRLSNAMGAWSINPDQNNLIIDLGTCIKYDLINKEGHYLGGNISPGMQMRYKALNSFTDKLPLISSKNFEMNFGVDTETSILNGVEQGMYHEINGFIERYSNQFDGLTIFMTGGTTKFFDKEYKNDIFANPNLTLIGLNEILDYNAE